MLATEMELPSYVFNFSGQTVFETWKLRDLFGEVRGYRYSEWLVNELPFCFQRIRDLADTFPFWQRRKKTGRPPIEERTLLIAYLVRQFFKATFRQVEGILQLFKSFFQVETVPDYTVMARKNASRRWLHLWKRFHRFVLNQLPNREAVLATDATGYHNLKRTWRDTDYGLRAIENWVKVHAAVEVDSFLVLNYELTRSNVHESRMFGQVWENLPANVTPVRSLADSAYTSEACLQTANKHGAKPFHDVKSNAVHHSQPKTAYEKLVNFALHWPNRFQEIKGKRSHVETAFSMIPRCFGHKLRCRNPISRKNEVQAKIVGHNIRLLAVSNYMNAHGV